ncbi:MAG: hypothetical protein CMJ40_08950 [Phycisphaerae bacterium]|nr:hypothetical protein [Phycisphaerae bacterium]|tara:strand:+ start:488 stop:1258 length:771 start_codon:yes stop_codon:yes gene_type:complete
MRSDGIKVTVQSRWAGGDEKAESISSTLGIPISTGERVPSGEFRIIILEDGVELWDEFSRRHGMPMNFRSTDLRTGSGSLSLKQPLARAVGRSARTILDATAGFGHDAFLLACLGWNVHAVERNPIIFTLLKESLLSATGDEQISNIMGDRLQITNQDAVAWMDENNNPTVDVVYLDPMFNTRPSSALPKKPAQILRRLVGFDTDVQTLFDRAMEHAMDRVVIKRSDRDPPLVDQPSVSYKGKMVRYDVYMNSGGG